MDAYEKQMEEYQAKMKANRGTTKKSPLLATFFYIFTKENDV
jgi:hypothetical protein